MRDSIRHQANPVCAQCGGTGDAVEKTTISDLEARRLVLVAYLCTTCAQNHYDLGHSVFGRSKNVDITQGPGA